MSTNTIIPKHDYYDESYVHPRRLSSYALQISWHRQLTSRSVLEVGKGDGYVAASLRHIGIKVDVLDIQPDLQPDLVGSVDDIPADDNAYDAVNCCQVLEHLPFDRVPKALAELRRVSKRFMVMSVPDVRLFIGADVRLPKLNDRSLQLSWNRRPAPDVAPSRKEAGHFWEIGCRGTPYKAVRNALQDAQWKVIKSFRNIHMAWHCFFICEK